MEAKSTASGEIFNGCEYLAFGVTHALLLCVSNDYESEANCMIFQVTGLPLQ